MRTRFDWALAIPAALALGACGSAPFHRDSTEQSAEVAPETAEDCFNPALTRSGTRYHISFHRVSPTNSVGAWTTTDADFAISNTVVVDDEDVTVSTGQGTISRQGNTVDVLLRMYSRFDRDAPATRRYRVELERRAERGVAPTSVTTTYSPPRLFRYDLQAGDSYTQRYEQTTVRERGEAVLSRHSQQLEVTITFVGKELVGGPTGLTTACRFEETRRPEDDATTTQHTYWIDTHSGLTVQERVEHDGGRRTNILRDAAVNGTPIRALRRR